MIDEETKQSILKQVAEGVPLSRVAKDHKMSRRGLQYWINPRPRSASGNRVGAPSKLSKRQSKWVKERLRLDKCSSSDI